MKTIKKLSLLCLFGMISIGASAYDFESGGIYYNITSSIKLTCEVTFKTTVEYSGIVNIPASVSYKSKTYSVTSIGYDAFTNCKGLSYVIIPNSVTSIGVWAFSGCSGLTSITIPNSVTSIGERTFSGCRGLTSIEIPNSVTSIGEGAFRNCSGLTSIEIPNSVTSIESGAFSGCSGMTSIVVGSENKYYDSRENCNALIETATNTLHTGCKNTIIPNSVTSIGKLAFSGCSALTSITIPNSVTSIGSSAFDGCSGLASVTIPNSVTIIGEYAFRDCSGLTSITIPNSVTSIGESAFGYCTGLTSVTIGNSVTSIGDCAFSDCSGLTSVTIGNSVTSIGIQAFYKCSGLTSVTIPNSVTSIGTWAFSGCSGLASVTIPNSVTSIGIQAFYGCTGLTSVTNLATTPQDIDSGAFSKYGTLHVIKGCKDAYAKADYWKKFTIVDDVEVTKVTSVTIDESTYYCDVNGIGQATATIKPDDAFDKKVTWSCSDPSKLFIDANTGQFLGIAVGAVIITATATDGSGVSGQAIVVVQEPSGIEDIRFNDNLNDNHNLNKDLYNLQGVKIRGQQNRGIVIKNGKKYVVK